MENFVEDQFLKHLQVFLAHLSSVKTLILKYKVEKANKCIIIGWKRHLSAVTMSYDYKESFVLQKRLVWQIKRNYRKWLN